MFSSLPCEQGEAWIILVSDMQRRKLPGDHKQSPRKPIRTEYFPYSRPWLVGCSIPAAKPRAGPERVPVDQSRSHRMRVGPVLPTGLHTLHGAVFHWDAYYACRQGVGWAIWDFQLHYLDRLRVIRVTTTKQDKLTKLWKMLKMSQLVNFVAIKFYNSSIET